MVAKGPENSRLCTQGVKASTLKKKDISLEILYILNTNSQVNTKTADGRNTMKGADTNERRRVIKSTKE